MESTNFFALLYRMRYINRWGLMRGHHSESLAEHSLDTAIISYALACIHNGYCGGSVDTKQVLGAAMFHDAGEIFTGDLPTPIKYQSPELLGAYKAVELSAQQKLAKMLPQPLYADFWDLMQPQQPQVQLLIKAADKISAYFKCVEEERSGNTEFSCAKQAQLTALEQMDLKEVEVFFSLIGNSFNKTLDELR